MRSASLPARTRIAVMAKSEEKATPETDAEAEPPAKSGGKKRLLIMVGAGVLLLAGAGAGAYFSGLLDGVVGGAKVEKTEEQKSAEAPPPDPVFYQLPDFLVSLNTGDRRPVFLKLKISLELTSDADRGRIDKLLPRVADYCQVYLRELRMEDLRGSMGTARLREELLRRIAAATAPVTVKDVLFGEMVVQ